MSYTPPAYNAVNFTWVGVPAYTPPVYTAVNFTWVPPVDAVTGVGDGVVLITGAAVGGLVFRAEGAGVVPITGAGAGYFGEVVAGVGEGVVSITGAAVGFAGAVGAGAGVVSVVGGGVGAAGASGAGAGVIPITGAGVALHPRYEVAGVVKLGGILVNRRVRAHLRSSGELVGQADTVAGAFRIHTGFEADEYTVTPIDLSPGATDWLPPAANRVTSTLAVDA
ncbi:hypothetical protein LJR118_002179 [Acidovorax sp. LjRoot118]|uniref:hypothetical protein n=1 Tax=Acidovorax sp. LjRoot118 TaxID=3342256 RepID=UPI003ECC33B0